MADWFLAWWPVISVVVGGTLAGIGLWARWSVHQQFVSHDAFDRFRNEHATHHDELEDRFREGDTRFTRLETALANLPTQAQFHDLSLGLERLGGEIKVVTEILKRVETPVRSMVEGALEAQKR